MARDTEEALFANLGILLGMSRGALSDEQWERQRPLLPSQRPRTGRPAKDHRTMLNGILWLLRTGTPWQDLPSQYGPSKRLPAASIAGNKPGYVSVCCKPYNSKSMRLDNAVGTSTL